MIKTSDENQLCGLPTFTHAMNVVYHNSIYIVGLCVYVNYVTDINRNLETKLVTKWEVMQRKTDHRTVTSLTSYLEVILKWCLEVILKW